jgi:hypothetical protein
LSSVALFFILDGQEHSLVVHRLPSAEDIRDFPFPSLVAFADTSSAAPPPASVQRQREAVSNLVDSMTLDQATATSTLLPLNPVLFNLYASLRAKINGRAAAAAGVAGGAAPTTVNINASTTMRDTIFHPFVNNAAVANAVHAVQESFSLEKLEASGKKRKSYWSELQIKSSGASQAAGIGAGGMQMDVSAPGFAGGAGGAGGEEEAGEGSYGEGETDAESVSGSSLAERPVFTVGSITPLEDFQAVLDFADSPVLRATQGEKEAVVKGAVALLLEIAVNNAKLGASSLYYKRSVNFLKSARDAVVSHAAAYPQAGLVPLFNAFLRDSIKLPFQFSRYQELWTRVVQEGISLISEAEAPEGGVSAAEASQFLTARVEAEAAASAPTTAEDDDDLFGSMA